jgi:hypothetical protein
MRDQQPERFTPYDVVRDEDLDVRGATTSDLFDAGDCDDDECARLVAEGRLRATTTELA